MKILKSLTIAAAILLLAGCAGRGSEDKTMPVPVHERETERVAVDEDSSDSTPKDTDTQLVAERQSETQLRNASEAAEETMKTIGETAVETSEEKTDETVSEKVAEKAIEETPAESTTETADETDIDSHSDMSPESDSATEPQGIIVAQGKEMQKNRSRKAAGWYAGVEGGLAFAESSFSSFGAGGSHAGGSGSLFAGYRFNSWLSLEIFAGLGGARMTARGCCSEANLWLSTDGEQFRAAVLGKEGGYYSELESSVLWQNYGLRLNFDILALIPATRDRKWSLELSPAISALGPKAKIRTMAAKTPVFNEGNWQFGAGGRVQAGYAVLPWMRAGLFTGLTFGTGRHIDALPADDHRNNFIWESGVRLTFSFTENSCKKSGR